MRAQIAVHYRRRPSLASAHWAASGGLLPAPLRDGAPVMRGSPRAVPRGDRRRGPPRHSPRDQCDWCPGCPAGCVRMPRVARALCPTLCRKHEACEDGCGRIVLARVRHASVFVPTDKGCYSLRKGPWKPLAQRRGEGPRFGPIHRCTPFLQKHAMARVTHAVHSRLHDNKKQGRRGTRSRGRTERTAPPSWPAKPPAARPFSPRSHRQARHMTR